MPFDRSQYPADCLKIGLDVYAVVPYGVRLPVDRLRSSQRMNDNASAQSPPGAAVSGCPPPAPPDPPTGGERTPADILRGLQWTL